MLPALGVTAQEPFLSGTVDQKKVWLQRLYKMMRRARASTGASAVDTAIVAAGLPAGSMTAQRLTFDQDLQQVQQRLETLLGVLLTFPHTRSPIGAPPNTAPTRTQADVLSTLMDTVESCYTEIADGMADAQIEEYFSVLRTDASAAKVRELFKSGAETVRKVKSVLKNGNPPPDSGDLRILIDVSGELTMKTSAALSSPREMIIEPSYAGPLTDPPAQSVRVATLLHECMHVTSAQIKDPMYWPNTAFFTTPFALRINNADHFARVALVYLATKGGDSGPPPKDTLYDKISSADDRKLIRAALEMAEEWVKTAWIYCLDAWNVLKRLHDDPTSYDHLGYFAGWRLQGNTKLISQISRATLHERARDPSAWVPSVTAFDLAAVEQTIGDLADLLGWIRRRTDVQIVANPPGTPAAGVLYIISDSLSRTRDPEALAGSIVVYGFSTRDQTTAWLREDELIGDVRAMVTESESFRSLPDKPRKA